MTLREYLAAIGQSSSRFAERIDVSPEAVRRYIKGERRPQADILARIRNVTDGAVRAADFFGESEP